MSNRACGSTEFVAVTATAVAELAEKIATKTCSAATTSLPVQLRINDLLAACSQSLSERTKRRPWESKGLPRPRPRTTVRLNGQLRPRYANETNETTFRYDVMCFGYDERLAAATSEVPRALDVDPQSCTYQKVNDAVKCRNTVPLMLETTGMAQEKLHEGL